MHEKKQPCIRFLKAVRFLDPFQLAAFDVSCYMELKADLKFPDSCDAEWSIYLGLAGNIDQTHPSPLQFWRAIKNRVPNLSVYAILLLQFRVHSADAERFFAL